MPISYTHTPTGKYFPAPTADLVSEWLMRSYPVHALTLSFHTPVTFKGDLSKNEEWGRLLNVVTAVKQADGAPAAQVYYGLIPTTNPAGDWYPRRWAGMGWMPERVSIGVDEEGSTLAHEVGHNFGLPHAPCGDVADPDPNYPYSGASIGTCFACAYGVQSARTTPKT